MWVITKRSGFTLIEVLIAISIIAVISAVGMGSFIGAQKRARDARRQSDLTQYRVALENYASSNSGTYPPNQGNEANPASGIFLSSGVLANYLTGFPTDPKPTTAGYDYFYRSDSSGTNWVLQGCMETSSTIFQVCSGGKAGIVPAAAGGACPGAPPALPTCIVP